MDISQWPGTVDEIVGGDQIVMLATVTPAGGTVLAPLTNFAIRDREAGTITLNSSIGGWKKLERIRRDPHVAVAFHTRKHARNGSPQYVLAQGKATLSPPMAGYPDTLGADWDLFDGPRPKGYLWNRWLRVYYIRIVIDIQVERFVVWPDLTCQGTPEVYGAPLPDGDPAPQKAPANGTGPRVDAAKSAARAAAFPDTLLGWTTADGYPMVVPAHVDGHDQDGLLIDAPFLPQGGRRAGMTSHAFEKYAGGQRQRIRTGWLDAADRVHYAPHTEFAFRMPNSKTIYRLGMGVAMRVAMRRARRAGLQFA
ncbi:pyridoxamine 5'-phosphate oxidase family protein [Actinomadura barringtoniae]|uniref:Pyridoxamine 5'-phosphate oxidase family protein n=1 Tax=Actinomadura barringtoniae TaxID=1427535 RepID=A0A939PDN5_9ACTN|nr:pyridoxamine 5'-phosphate oxidase family protein [Actinomadura barringtoniae]MBO2450418.1 pyridoxamine 5'-phosphate oxidase family protein [Actinomadura barringtoniae]